MTFKEKFQVGLKIFLRFLYDSETGNILGRTFFSWIKLILFYVVFYLFFTAIFAVHLSAFLAVTPHPGNDVTPWNFGKYAYPNYPNSKIALVSVPKTITYREGSLVLDDFTQRSIDKLLPSATVSGVSSECLDKSTKHGYDLNQPCIFLHVAKVFDWSPLLINESLANQQSLPIICTAANSQSNLVIDITYDQEGIPLNLTNNEDAQSFPYTGQTNYSTPVMAIKLNMTNIPSDLPNKLSASISCGIDFNSLDISEPSANTLKRLYEVPDNAIIKLNFRS